MHLKQIKYLIVSLLLFLCSTLIAQIDIPSDSLKIAQDDKQVDEYIHQIDSMIQLKLFEKKSEIIDTTGYALWGYSDTIPEYPEMFFEFKFAELNKRSPIEFVYNEHVQHNIHRYTVIKREEFKKIKGMSYLYFPIMEEALQKYDLPLELKYIAVIESSLNPLAKSRSGAVGLWQFLLHSGKLFDLEVTSYIDERKDPYKATDAACRYLKYLHKTFNDWPLAIAAYNGGPGEVRNAILKSGGKTDFWEIREYMREETQNYVPKFMAACYVLNYAAEHNIQAVIPKYTYYDIDTVWISNALSFQQITEKIDLEEDLIRFLNPAYTLDYIPDLGQPQLLVLPSNKITEYIKKENRIYANRIEQENYMDLRNNAGSTENRRKIIHTVKKGEFYHKIAVKYNCSIENIKAWNNIEDKGLYPGQKLNIWVDKDYDLLTDSSTVSSTGKKITVYTVQKGDTLWKIAEMYDCPSIQEIIDLNKLGSGNDLKPGQKLKIYVN